VAIALVHMAKISKRSTEGDPANPQPEPKAARMREADERDR